MSTDKDVSSKREKINKLFDEILEYNIDSDFVDKEYSKVMDSKNVIDSIFKEYESRLLIHNNFKRVNENLKELELKLKNTKSLKIVEKESDIAEQIQDLLEELEIFEELDEDLDK